MSDFTRRDFLKQVALGAGVAALYNLGQPLPTLAGFAQAAPMVFWQGNILDISGDILIVKGGAVTFDGVSAAPFGDGSDTLTIQTNKDVSIWRGNEVTLTEVQKGDFLYGRGFPASEKGAILGQRLWVNLGQYRGIIVEVKPGEVRLEGQEYENFVKATVFYDENTDINNGEGKSESIGVGKYMQAIGLLQGDSSLKATRIWI